MKRTGVIGLLIALFALTPAPARFSAVRPRSFLPKMATADFPERARPAVERGLAWLASVQKANGSWVCRVGHKLYEQYEGEEGEHVGVTALACMAFMAAGNTPGRGPYGAVVDRALGFVLSCVRDEDGYITHDGTRMYSHAFATMFLAEVYGMTKRRDVRIKLQRSVNLLVNAQCENGGWRYSPIPVDADLSVTVSTVQALRAARNVGLAVPLDTIEKAIKYVRDCAPGRGRSGFTYQRGNGSDYNVDTRITLPLTACGLVSLASAGDYDSTEVVNGMRALERLHQNDRLYWGQFHYFYGHYYATQAYYLIASRTSWRDYRDRFLDEVLNNQIDDGHWEDDVGPAYATAMACLVLCMPGEWLPIFQK